jgi:hypothetical protein
MKWLARLKKQEVPDTDTTKPTEPGFVGFVAPLPRPIQKIEVPEPAANDGTCQVGDPDRWCWPHSAAMNTAEIDAFTERLARFTDKGLALGDSEALADKLKFRDRDLDDRCVCLECAHLSGTSPWRCGNWDRAALGGTRLGAELVVLLQRCDGFGGWKNGG